MHPHVVEWLNLALRWFHIIAGVAWIGASFYFNFLENMLERNEDENRDEIAGHLWAIHGGGIYYLEKYKIAPTTWPKHLHWFKWEAYMTWLSGFLLLIVVYYLNAKVYLIDTAVMDLSPAAAIGLSVASLVVGWGVYDGLCRSPLVKKPMFFSGLIFLLMCGAAFGLAQVFSGRAAYLHVGAMIGTMMAGNVLMVIIPMQRRMVAAAAEGRAPDATHGKKALLRSRHNNYLTLPVLFIMISNHFPSTYGSSMNWAVLIGISVIGASVRHYFNVRHLSQKSAWVIPAGVIGMIALAFATSPSTGDDGASAAIAAHAPVSFIEARSVIDLRCLSCHAAKPTDDVFVTAPNDVAFDTPERIQQYAERIKVRTTLLKTMPLANKTQMTDAERLLLGAWVHQGAKLE